MQARTHKPQPPATPTAAGGAGGAPSGLPAEASSGPPIIAINGDNPATIPIGATYADLGATICGPAADKNLGITTLADGATTTPITLDATKPSTHTILYTVTDPKGPTGTVMRIVIVTAPKAAIDNHATTTPIVATSTPSLAPAANDNATSTTAASSTAH